MGRPQGKVLYDNRGRVVLVSGGASGIGRAVVDAFLDSGANVVCLDYNQSAAASMDQRVAFFLGNTARELDCQAAVAFTVQQFGGLDVLVNNAAVQPPSSYVPLHQVEAADWQRMVDINLSGYQFLAKHSVRQMLQQESGVIINMASGQAHRTARNVPCYGPLKAGNLMQTMQWGVEYARHGIRVVSVSPGAINTPLVQASLAAQGGAAQLANRHPLGRIGEPAEIAAAVLWLSSSEASFVTATDLQVDGGLGGLGSFADPYPLPSTTSETLGEF
jgi:NAD(P)-dependent dehydrogenase (short-subunit alcohol dehydrogenase family)